MVLNKPLSSAKLLKSILGTFSPFYSPASFNGISIDGIHFASISCCLVGQAPARFPVVKNNLLLTDYA